MPNPDDLYNLPSTSTGHRGGRPPPPHTLKRHHITSSSASSSSDAAAESSSSSEDAGAKDFPEDDDYLPLPAPKPPASQQPRRKAVLRSSIKAFLVKGGPITSRGGRPATRANPVDENTPTQQTKPAITKKAPRGRQATRTTRATPTSANNDDSSSDDDDESTTNHPQPTTSQQTKPASKNNPRSRPLPASRGKKPDDDYVPTPHLLATAVASIKGVKARKRARRPKRLKAREAIKEITKELNDSSSNSNSNSTDPSDDSNQASSSSDDDDDLKVVPSIQRWPDLPPDPTSPNHFAEKFTVEAITDRDWDSLTGELIYKVKWVNWPEQDSTWEKPEDLDPRHIKAFEDRWSAQGLARSAASNKSQAEIKADMRAIMARKVLTEVRSMLVGCDMAAIQDEYDLHFEGGACILVTRAMLPWLSQANQKRLLRWLMRNEAKIFRLKRWQDRKMLRLAERWQAELDGNLVEESEGVEFSADEEDLEVEGEIEKVFLEEEEDEE